MAVDKLVDSTLLDANLTSVANAIRAKGGASGSLAFPAGFVSAVQAIPTGSTPTGTKQINITQNGTTTEDVAAYANAEITVDVQGGGGPTDNEYATGAAPSGSLNISTNIAQQVFYKRNNITKVTQTAGGVAARAFQDSTGLQFFIGIGTTYFYAQVFKGCSGLEAVDIGNPYTHRFESENFGQCSSLTVLVIRKNSVVALQGGINVFISTPFASNGAGGTLYVPQALIADYQAATNWITILGYANNRIQAIEGSQYENYYADGTPIS